VRSAVSACSSSSFGRIAAARPTICLCVSSGSATGIVVAAAVAFSMLPLVCRWFPFAYIQALCERDQSYSPRRRAVKAARDRAPSGETRVSGQAAIAP
jgi:hypothetical protein